MPKSRKIKEFIIERKHDNFMKMLFVII